MFILLSANAQSWTNVGTGISNNVYDLIEFDNKLYAGGRLGMSWNGVASWNGSTWTSLPTPFGIAYPLTLAAYKDTLYVSGAYPFSGPTGVFKYDGAAWVQAGGPFYGQYLSTILELLPFNGQLISGGKYFHINGVSANNIAAWNGQTWNALGDGLNDVVTDLAEHNGQLFASGNFTASGTDSTVKYFAKWNGTNWSALDTTHEFKVFGPMISFNNALILGVTDTIAGVPMQGVASWNGSSFTPMGNSLIKGVGKFWIFNNELYLAGDIHTSNPYADDHVVMRWDGLSWQQVGSTFNDHVLTFAEYNNELYCGGFFSISNSYVAKLSLTSGVAGNKNQAEIKVYPNPANNSITISSHEKGTFRITNQVGQQVMNGMVSDHKTQILVDDLPAGIYFLNFRTDKHHSMQKIVIQK